MRKKSKPSIFFQIFQLEKNEQPLTKEKVKSLNVKREPQEKKRNLSKNQVILSRISEENTVGNIQNMLYLSKIKGKQEIKIKKKFMKNHEVNIKKVRKGDINYQKVDPAALYMTKVGFQKKKKPKENELNRRINESSEKEIEHHFLFSQEKIMLKDIIRPFQVEQKKNESEKSHSSQSMSVVNDEISENTQEFIKSHKLSPELLNLQQRQPKLLTKKIHNIMQFKCSIPYQNNPKRQGFKTVMVAIKKVNICPTPQKKMNFKLGIFGEFWNRTGLKEFCYLKIILKKLFKENKNEIEEKVDKIIYGMLNDLPTEFSESLRGYLESLFQFKLCFHGYVLEDKGKEELLTREECFWIFLKVRKRYHFIKVKVGKSLSVSFSTIYEKGQFSEDISQICLNLGEIDEKEVKKKVKSNYQFFQYISKQIEKEFYQLDLCKNYQFQEQYNSKLKTNIRIKTSQYQYQLENVFGKRKVLTFQQPNKSKMKMKKKPIRNKETSNRQGNNADDFVFKHHSHYDYGVRKERKSIKVNDSYFYYQNLRNYKLIGVFGDQKVSFINIKNNFQKEQFIILNLPFDFNKKLFKNETKRFLDRLLKRKELKNVHKSAEESFKFVFEKKIFHCLIHEKKNKLKIIITSSRNQRVDFFTTSLSDVKDEEGSVTLSTLTSYCSKLRLKKKNIYSSYDCDKREIIKVFYRKVRKLCHGVFVIFNLITMENFYLSAIRFYVSELQKNFLVFIPMYIFSGKQDHQQKIQTLFQALQEFYFEEMKQIKNKNKIINTNKKYQSIFKGFFQKSFSQKNDQVIKIGKMKNKKLKSLSINKDVFNYPYKILEEQFFRTFKSPKTLYNYLIIFYSENQAQKHHEVEKASKMKKKGQKLNICIYRENQYLVYKFQADIYDFLFRQKKSRTEGKHEENTKYDIYKYFGDKIMKIITENKEKRTVLMRKFKQFFLKKYHSKPHTSLYSTLGEPSESYYMRITKRFELILEERMISKNKIIIIKDNETQKMKTMNKFSCGFASGIPLKDYSKRLIKRMIKTIDYEIIQ